MNNSTKFTALFSSVLLLAALATPASAIEPVHQKDVSVESLDLSQVEKITTDKDAPISFERVSITSTHTELPVAPVETLSIEPAAVHSVPVPQAVPAPPAQSVVPLASPTTTAPAAAQTPAAAPVQGHGGLAGAALAQIGVAQDCTAMVENALRSIGVSVGDLGPAQFAQFGTPVSNIQAGDILIYPGHVSIAISPTEAVHGGLNGMNTGIAGVNVPSAPYQIIRP